MKIGTGWLLLCVALVGCAKDPSADKQALTAPTDQATQDDRSQIDATLTKIEGFTRALGKPRTFRSVPIIVTEDSHYTDHPAACVALNQVPQFILVKPSVFDDEARIAPGQVQSELFRVLLHEIGHCYFHREHEEVQISEPGKLVEIDFKQGGLNGQLQFPSLDATVMVPENLVVPVALEKYYVAEILGIARASKLEDLAPYAPLKYVDEPTPQ